MPTTDKTSYLKKLLDDIGASGGAAGQVGRRPAASVRTTSRLGCTLPCVSSMNISEARERLAEVIDAAQSEAVVLQRHGRPAAVLVSVERYEELLAAAEEAEDNAAFDAAMAEAGDNLPWEQVKADLGWS